MFCANFRWRQMRFVNKMSKGFSFERPKCILSKCPCAAKRISELSCSHFVNLPTSSSLPTPPPFPPSFLSHLHTRISQVRRRKNRKGTASPPLQMSNRCGHHLLSARMSFHFEFPPPNHLPAPWRATTRFQFHAPVPAVQYTVLFCSVHTFKFDLAKTSYGPSTRRHRGHAHTSTPMLLTLSSCGWHIYSRTHLHVNYCIRLLPLSPSLST